MTIRYDVYEKNKNLKAGYRIYPAVVTYQKDGKQRRKVFQCREQAKLFHDEMKSGVKRLGKAFFDLKPAEADLAYRALQRSKENGYDLFTALAFYEAQTKASANAIIDNIVEKVIGIKNTSLNTKKYKLNFEREVIRFASAHKGRYMDTFTTEDVDKFVNDSEKGWSVTTKEYNKRLLSVFFNIAKDLKYTLNNPVKFLNKKQYKKANPTYIEFFTPEDARHILRAASAGRPEYVVPLVLTLFNGPRIDTSCRMIAADIHLDYDTIVIPDAIDKSFGSSIASVWKRINEGQKEFGDSVSKLSEHINNVDNHSIDKDEVRKLVNELNSPLAELLESLDDKIDHLNEQMARAEEREKMRDKQ